MVTNKGKVVSTKMNKTVIIEMDSSRAHPLYKKTMRKTRRFAVHNEIADIKEGDFVLIQETTPISKTKHYKVINKIEKF